MSKNDSTAKQIIYEVDKMHFVELNNRRHMDLIVDCISNRRYRELNDVLLSR